ncbi:hypothetical protein Tco_1223081 [Tanacetum coccineum]
MIAASCEDNLSVLATRNRNSSNLITIQSFSCCDSRLSRNSFCITSVNTPFDSPRFSRILSFLPRVLPGDGDKPVVGFDNIMMGFVEDVEIVVEVVFVRTVVDSIDLVTYSTRYIRYQTGDIVRTRLSVEMKVLRDLKKMMNLGFEASRGMNRTKYHLDVEVETFF